PPFPVYVWNRTPRGRGFSIGGTLWGAPYSVGQPRARGARPEFQLAGPRWSRTSPWASRGLPMRATLQWLTHPFTTWRYLVERLVVVPAAARLPLPAALFIADTFALLDLAVPSAATRRAWREIAAATGRTGLGASPIVFDRIAMPGRELVYLTRMR